jgi:hypothetical protein
MAQAEASDLVSKGLQCPKCYGYKLRVRDTKPQPDGTIRRYRKCMECEKVITTIERPRVIPITRNTTQDMPGSHLQCPPSNV